MDETKLSQIMALKNKTLAELQAKYEELFGEQKPTSNNKVFIWRKIAYRMQEIELGGISDETQTRIDELIEQFDPVNNKSLRPEDPNHPKKKTKKSKRDFRLPIPGTVITKQYKDKSLQVKILEVGFEYNNKTYKTLSAIAQEVTGAHWNGYLFFNL